MKGPIHANHNAGHHVVRAVGRRYPGAGRGAQEESCSDLRGSTPTNPGHRKGCAGRPARQAPKAAQGARVRPRVHASRVGRLLLQGHGGPGAQERRVRADLQRQPRRLPAAQPPAVRRRSDEQHPRADADAPGEYWRVEPPRARRCYGPRARPEEEFAGVYCLGQGPSRHPRCHRRQRAVARVRRVVCRPVQRPLRRRGVGQARRTGASADRIPPGPELPGPRRESTCSARRSCASPSVAGACACC